MNNRLENIRSQALNDILGVETISSSNGNGELRAIVNETTVNPSGFYHGGAIYTLCDVCAMSGLSSLLDEGKEAVTHDIHVSVIRPANKNDKVLYRSKVIKLGRRICFLEVEVTVNKKIIAKANVTKSIV